MANNIPSRIKVESSKYQLFMELKDHFSKAYNSDVFALALAYGYKLGIKQPISSKEAFIAAPSVSDELKSMIFLVGISEFGSNHINELVENPVLMYEAAEEYANAGIDVLYREFEDVGSDFDFKLCGEFADSIRCLESNKLKEE